MISIFVLSVTFLIFISAKTIPRDTPTANLIGNKLYVLGGDVMVLSGSYRPTNDFFYLDVTDIPFNNTIGRISWTDITHLGKVPANSWASSAIGGVNNDLIFLFGGQMEFNNDSALVYVFDTNKEEWNKPNIKGATPLRRRNFAAVSDDAGKMYIFGGTADKYTGYPNTTDFNDMTILDTVNLIWYEGSKEGAPIPRTSYAVAILPDGIIIYIGGIQRFPNETYEYVDMSEVWSTMQNFAKKIAEGNIPGVRGEHTAVLAPDGRIIIYGGEVNDTAANPQLCVLNTTTTPYIWSQPKSYYPVPDLWLHTAVMVGNYMVVAFGFSPTHGRTSDVYILDLSENDIYKWITLFLIEETIKPEDVSCYKYIIPNTKEAVGTTIALLLGGFGGGVCVAASSYIICRAKTYNNLRRI
ncbi:12285_t:CDS:2 [Funneliformis caledonium]|uniref:12285_t:CDS:1 n=1 Tax=Funneliformis caledonium TaxID=1117310 RepID=A0A9N9A1D5_9GLOM|nr:12285_t:CDS:2 [Funneliformis caledonium]